MSTKRAKPLITDGGSAVPVAANRIAKAQELLTRGGYSKARDGIMLQFGISKATAERDLAEAYRLIASDAETERPYLRTREVARLDRLAAAAETLGDKGDAAGYSAAIRASQQIAKLCGLEAPTEIKGALTIGMSDEQKALLGALSMSPHERRQRIAALTNAVRADAAALEVPGADPDTAG